MGLDVHHLQLTLTPNDEGDFFRVEDWDLDCNVSLQNYSKFITTIDTIDYVNWIGIIESESQFEKLKQTQSFDWLEKIFIGEYDDIMQRRLEKYIITQKLENLKKTQHSVICNEMKYHLISFDKPVKVQGMYYLEVGHQRNGMNDLYYDIFQKYWLWGKKEDFELAYSCVGGEWYLEYWGQGIMLKAIEDIVEYGFRTFDIVRIFARPFSTNLKSQRVLEKAGFTFDAKLKRALFKNGEFMDEIIYAKLKD